MGFCEFIGDEFDQVHCRTSLDNHMVMLTYNCSYDGGPSQTCKELNTVCFFLFLQFHCMI